MSAVTRIGLESVIETGFRDGTGENPIWDVALARWWWIDQPKGLIHRLDPASGVVESRAIGEMAGSMVLTGASQPVLAGERAILAVYFDSPPDAAALAPRRILAEITHARPDMRFNDGRCDRQGRFWVSSMVKDITLANPAGQLLRFTPESGLIASPHGGIVIPNGSAFSPDGRIFYVSDSHRDRRMVWAFDYDTDTGTAHNRRVFIDMRDMLGRPDGAAVDTDGCYWICCHDEGCVKRFTPAGLLDRVIEVPMKKPTMCAFGGDDLSTLMVTSLCRGEADLVEDPHGGRVLLLRPGAQGIAEPRLLGGSPATRQSG